MDKTSDIIVPYSTIGSDGGASKAAVSGITKADVRWDDSKAAALTSPRMARGRGGKLPRLQEEAVD